MPVYGPNLNIASNGLWHFPLIAKVGEESSQYTPNSDASLCINEFPHLVLEVISNPNRSDHTRMLLQAACLARLGRALCDPLVPLFTVSAVYINETLQAQWYLVYQPCARDTAVGLIFQRLLTTYVSAG